MEMVEDVVDLALNAVLRHGGAVEVVRASPALDKAEGFGAILRY